MFRYKTVLKISIVLAALAVVLLLVFSNNSPIQAEEGTDSRKYYTSITIDPGDSLWAIAIRYMDGHYSNVQEYINELKLINNLTSDTIHAYEHLLVAYYE